MAMQWTSISVPFNGGIDTKHDEKTLPAGKLARLENGVFSKRGSIKKRSGYTEFGNKTNASSPATISASKGLYARGDEVVMVDGAKLYSYAENTDNWSDLGSFESVRVTQTAAAGSNAEQTYADRATAGGLVVYAWEDSRGGAYYAVYDSTSGATARGETQISSVASRPRCLAVNGKLHVYYIDTTNTRLEVLVITPSSLSTATKTVATDAPASNPNYDVCKNSAGTKGYIAYRSDTSKTHIVAVDASGVTVAGTGVISQDCDQGLGIANEGTNDVFGVAMASSTDGVDLTVISAALTTGPGLSFDVTIDAASATNQNITVAFDSATTGTVLWENVQATPAAANKVEYRKFTNSASWAADGAKATLVDNLVGLGSKAWVDNSNIYVTIAYQSTLQSTYFVVRRDGLILAKMLPGTGGGVLSKGHLPQMEDLGSSKYAMAGIYKVRLNTEGDFDTVNGVYTEKGVKDLQMDHGSSESYQGVTVGETLYLAGGILWQYDGNAVVESGFHVYPEPADADFSALDDAGSMTSSVSYSYRMYYEWTNARGEREQSTCARAYTIAMGGSDDTVQIDAPKLSITKKTGVAIAIYRTAADPSQGSPFYRITSLDPTATGANGYLSNDSITTYSDKMADSALIQKELDYQNTGELDNIAPPANSIIAAGKDRVFLSGFERKNLVRFSKTTQEARAVRFNDALEILVDEDGGAVTGLAILNELLVVFTRTRIFAVAGDGPNNLGFGAFDNPRLVSTDVGCTDQRSIVLTPDGVMFQSKKGIYLLDQQLRVTYIGAEVEDFNSQTITSATVAPDTNQVRFLTSGGFTLVYDWYFRQWSTFTGHEGVAAVNFSDVYHYVTSGGVVRKESSTAVTDGGASFRMLMQTAWLSMKVPQGFQRVKTVAVLGKFRSDHTLNMLVGYDYEPGMTKSTTFATSGIVTESDYGDDDYGDGDYGGSQSSVYQFRSNIPRQKCQSIRFMFYDDQGTSPGASYEITALDMRVGVKQGLNRLPATRTV